MQHVPPSPRSRLRVKRRPSAALVVSIAVHVAAGGLLYYVLQRPYPLSRLFREEHVDQAPVERIGFIALPRGTESTPGKRGGDGRALRPSAPQPALVAPATVPTAVPQAPGAAKPAPDEGGLGP